MSGFVEVFENTCNGKSEYLDSVALVLRREEFRWNIATYLQVFYQLRS